MLKLLKKICLLLLSCLLVSGCLGVSVYDVKGNIDSSTLSDVPKVAAYELLVEIVQGVYDRDDGAGTCLFVDDGIRGPKEWEFASFEKFEDLKVYTLYAEKKNSSGWVEYGPGYILKFEQLKGWAAYPICEVGGMTKQEIDDSVKALTVLGIGQIGS